MIRVDDLKLTLGVSESKHMIQAAWSCCLENEQLAVVLPNELRFVLPKVDQLSALQSVKTSYNCVAWSPSSSSKGSFLLAAINNRIDVLDGITGKLIISFNAVTRSEKDEGGKWLRRSR